MLYKRFMAVCGLICFLLIMSGIILPWLLSTNLLPTTAIIVLVMSIFMASVVTISITYKKLFMDKPRKRKK